MRGRECRFAPPSERIFRAIKKDVSFFCHVRIPKGMRGKGMAKEKVSQIVVKCRMTLYDVF